jgi:hypothetical protein
VLGFGFDTIDAVQNVLGENNLLDRFYREKMAR